MDTRDLGHLYTDCLVIGGGVAGMRAALAVAKAGHVIILAKSEIQQSNTFYAQGGIASVLEKEDSIESHVTDTLTAGCGLCDPKVVDWVISRGPQQIEQLRQWATPFDMREGQVATGKEGGHSHNRIAHALGDATGKAMVNSILEMIKRESNIKLFDHCYSIDLLTEEGSCYGVVCRHPHYGYQCIWARRTILATGGAGRLYRETTNPDCATADGLAMAYRAGAILTDLEFVQFHPTTLYVAGATRALITEAIRGEGGVLIDRDGRRFMADYHELEDLAPRDVVSRAIFSQMEKTRSSHLFLDVRHLGRKWFSQRFPTIYHLCQAFDIDVETDLIPIRPSAHYMIGGVKTDIKGRTNIKNLYCCGETAATGLHGANRLASNSLLEGMVFGKDCGDEAAKEISESSSTIDRHHLVFKTAQSARTQLDISDVTNSARSLMTRNVGINRQEDRLAETIENIDFWQSYVLDKVFDDPKGWQCQNMLTISRLIAQAALDRKESRGVHYRSDYPQTDDAHYKRHMDTVPLVV